MFATSTCVELPSIHMRSRRQPPADVTNALASGEPVAAGVSPREKLSRLFNTSFSICRASFTSTAWASRAFVSYQAAELLKGYIFGDSLEPANTTEGYAQRMFAHTMAQIITTQFVGLVHGANENFANLVHLAFGKCGFKVTGPPSHEPFANAQKFALPMGWGLNAAARAGQAQAENVLPSTKNFEDVLATDFQANVLYTFLVGLLVQGSPFLALVGAEDKSYKTKPLTLQPMEDAASRMRATLKAEMEPGVNHKLLPLGVEQGMLNAYLERMAANEDSLESRVFVAAMCSLLIHRDRIAGFMVNKALYEKLPSAARMPDTGAWETTCRAVQVCAFSLMSFCVLQGFEGIPDAPVDRFGEPPFELSRGTAALWELPAVALPGFAINQAGHMLLGDRLPGKGGETAELLLDGLLTMAAGAAVGQTGAFAMAGVNLLAHLGRELYERCRAPEDAAVPAVPARPAGPVQGAGPGGVELSVRVHITEAKEEDAGAGDRNSPDVSIKGYGSEIDLRDVGDRKEDSVGAGRRDPVSVSMDGYGSEVDLR